MSGTVGVVDYGSGNLRSMRNALETVAEQGQKVLVVSEADAVAAVDRIVLPGVGAFGECGRLLAERGLVQALSEHVSLGRPLLGVCVGMQLFAEEGLEHGARAGLGWLTGVVRCLEVGPGLKLPHVGWSPVEDRTGPLFEGIKDRDHFYFVHSYVLDCRDPTDCCAVANYGERFTAAVHRRNLCGTQFHPEKSDRPGLKVLANFCRWMP